LRAPISNCNCDYCHTPLTNWDYRYKGKHYCRKCYELLFSLKICSVCKKKKMINNKLKVPICKSCQQKDLPCIRCEKKDYTNGKITEFGPVCKSCAKYFTEKKKCSECNQYMINVSNRVLQDGTTLLLCQKCYNKKLPVCSKCDYRKKPYSYDIVNKKPICKICSIEVSRKCIKCGNSFPAGYGTICQECVYTNTLAKRTAFIKDSLSGYTREIFNDFGDWLSKKRGIKFTATHIQNYQKYFLSLDMLSNTLGRIPTYEEIVSKFSVAKTRKNLLVTIFLNEQKIAMVNKKIQEEYANIDMINRFLDKFQKGTYNSKLIKKYYIYLYEKYKNNKTTIRSMRLALTPAVRFLTYCKNFDAIKPSNLALSGYLWCYPGQKAAITGFINFIVKKYKLQLSIKDIKKNAFTRPSLSNEQLKQRLINILRDRGKRINNQKYFFDTAIGYLHGIDMPKNVFINIKDIKLDSSGDWYIRMGGRKFYLPEDIINFIISQK